MERHAEHRHSIPSPPRWNLARKMHVRRLLFAVILVIGFILFMESISWVFFSLLEGHTITQQGIDLLLAEAKKTSEDQTRMNPFIRESITRIVHPYLGFATPPTTRKENVRTHGQELMEDYGFGENSGPLMNTLRPDTLVIGLFGGSAARQFLDRGGTNALVDELKKLPQLAGKNIAISSGAFYNYRQPQPLLALDYVLTLGAKFDFLIEIDGFDEVFRTGPEGMNSVLSPFFPYQWTQYMRITEADPTLRLKIGDLALRIEKRNNRVNLFGSFPLRRSMTAMFLWRALDRQSEAVILTRQADLINYRSSLDDSYAVRGPVPHYDSEEIYYADRASVWEETARQMSILSEQNTMRYFHFLQPNGYVADAKPLTKQEQTLLTVEGCRYSVNLGYPLLREAGKKLKDEGASFTDLTGIFRSTNNTIFIDDCSSMNPLGNAIMGRYIADVIKRELEREPLKK